MESYKKMWKEAFNTSGRTRRKDYWGAMGINILVSFVLGIILALFTDTFLDKLMIVLLAIYGVAVIVPSTTMAIRRLHDIGKSGWVYVVYLVLNLVFAYSNLSGISGILSIGWIVVSCLDSTEDNEWGPNPKNDSIA